VQLAHVRHSSSRPAHSSSSYRCRTARLTPLRSVERRVFECLEDVEDERRRPADLTHALYAKGSSPEAQAF
jgi:hypothetical protein